MILITNNFPMTAISCEKRRSSRYLLPAWMALALTSQLIAVAIAAEDPSLNKPKSESLRQDEDGTAVIKLDALKQSRKIKAIAASKDGKTIAVARGNRFDLQRRGSQRPFARSKQTLRKDFSNRFLEGFEEHIWDLSYSISGDSVFGIRYDGVVLQWDANTAKVIKTLSGHAKGGRTLDVSPIGKLLATGGIAPAIMLWNLDDPAGDAVLETSGCVNQLVFSPDGTKLAAADSAIRRVQVYDISSRSKKIERTFSDYVDLVGFTPDGEKIICLTKTARRPDVLRWIDVVSGADVDEVDRKQECSIWRIRSTAPKGYLATISGHGTLCIWKLQDLSVVHTMSTSVQFPGAIAWMPEMKSLVVGDGERLREFPLPEELELTTQGPEEASGTNGAR